MAGGVDVDWGPPCPWFWGFCPPDGGGGVMMAPGAKEMVVAASSAAGGLVVWLRVFMGFMMKPMKRMLSDFL